MQLRSAGVPDEPSRDDASFAHQYQGEADNDGDWPPVYEERDPVHRYPDGSVRFGVPGRIIGAKFATAALIAVLGLLVASGSQLAVALVAAAALALYALRDVIARERLRADVHGLVAVRGYASHDRLSWADIEQVRVDSRTRLGSSTHLLEVDAGDHIYLYSRFDLGVDPDDAARAIESVRPR